MRGQWIAVGLTFAFFAVCIAVAIAGAQGWI